VFYIQEQKTGIDLTVSSTLKKCSKNVSSKRLIIKHVYFFEGFFSVEKNNSVVLCLVNERETIHNKLK